VQSKQKKGSTQLARSRGKNLRNLGLVKKLVNRGRWARPPKMLQEKRENTYKQKAAKNKQRAGLSYKGNKEKPPRPGTQKTRKTEGGVMKQDHKIETYVTI